MKIVLLYSGGVDSTVLLYDQLYKGDTVMPLLIDYGQRHSKELDAARSICLLLCIEWVEKKLCIPWWRDSPLTGGDGPLTGAPTVVPGRNTVFLSLALSLAESIGYDTVMLAAHRGDNALYPDCREEYLTTWRRLAASISSVNVCAPFIHYEKSHVVERGRELHVPFEMTWSCYAGGEVPCGSCGACVEREKALGLIGGGAA